MDEGQPGMGTTELRELARFVFGDRWRERLAGEMGLERRDLVLELAEPGPVRPALAARTMDLAEDAIARNEDEHRQLRARIARWRMA